MFNWCRQNIPLLLSSTEVYTAITHPCLLTWLGVFWGFFDDYHFIIRNAHRQMHKKFEQVPWNRFGGLLKSCSDVMNVEVSLMSTCLVCKFPVKCDFVKQQILVYYAQGYEPE